MTISNISNEYIEFDNGKKITFTHEQDCCECNYADFDALNNLTDDSNYVYTIEFQEPLTFESVNGFGFRFGDEGNMFFIPCYSEQNGYYSSDITILYDDEEVISLGCEVIE